MRISLAGEVIHLYSSRTCIFHFLKYLMQRGAAPSQAAGMCPASPWGARPHQARLCSLHSSSGCTAQRKAFHWGAGRSMAGLQQSLVSTRPTALLFWFRLARPEQSAAAANSSEGHEHFCTATRPTLHVQPWSSCFLLMLSRTRRTSLSSYFNFYPNILVS